MLIIFIIQNIKNSDKHFFIYLTRFIDIETLKFYIWNQEVMFYMYADYLKIFLLE